MHKMSEDIADQLSNTIADFNKTKNWLDHFRFEVVLATLAIEALLNIAEAIRSLKG